MELQGYVMQRKKDETVNSLVTDTSKLVHKEF